MTVQRRNANTMPAAPSTSATTGNPHAHDADPAVRRREQDALAVLRDVRVADLRSRSGPRGYVSRRRCGSRADSTALLSATDSPVHTGHASSLSRRAARAASGWRSVSNAPRAPRRRPRRRRRAPNHGTHDRLNRRRPRLARSASHASRSASETGPRPPHAATPVGRDHVRLGLTGRSRSRARRSRSGSSATGHLIAVGRDVVADRRRRVVADDPDHREVRIVLVRGVERLQRGLFLLARDAPRVPEVHDVGLAGERLRADRLAVERR